MRGKIQRASMERPASRRFIIHRHQAERLHYDLRLEFRGVLKSWALPKEPADKAGAKRLAVAMKDHALEYVEFEGSVPEGEYGPGLISIWDRGTYTLEEDRQGKWIFFLKGKRLWGRFALVKFQEPRNWLFIKLRERDTPARWRAGF